ncbi:MAG: SMP-30/gluconolactonase/LRE family protein [Porticoccaceae bacterium]
MMKNKHMQAVLLTTVMASAQTIAEDFNQAIDVTARASNWKPSLRYPDPAIEVIDPSFMKYRLFNASVEQLATGFRWGEGPAWNEEEGYLVFSDLPNSRMIRWDEQAGKASVYNAESNNSNGNIYDLQGRLITAEHLGRRVIRTEKDGSTTVLADSYQGRKLNSPNDLAIESDGSVWFTDPPFGLGSYYEGVITEPELDFHGVYRVDAETGELELILDGLVGPNGLAFSPDGKYLYVVEARATPNRLLWRYDVGANGNLSNKTLHFEAFNSGAIDGFKVDVDGNIWAGWGSDGTPGVDPAPMDGVIVINPNGEIIGHIHTPERCANVVFGGEHRNRLLMTCSHSIYSLFVNTQGAY